MVRAVTGGRAEATPGAYRSDWADFSLVLQVRTGAAPGGAGDGDGLPGRAGRPAQRPGRDGRVDHHSAPRCSRDAPGRSGSSPPAQRRSTD